MMTKKFEPVFLLCSERSGSNLLVRLLDSHPQFCGPPPSHIIRTLALNLTRFGNLKDNDQNWYKLIEISVSILHNQFGQWQSKLDEETLQELVEERSVRGVISAIYQAEMEAQRKQFCAIKENRVYLFLPYLLIAFPQAKYIWLVRDPRDMALSWKNSPNHPGGVRRGAGTWQEDQERFRTIYGYLRENDKVHYLRYEDLLQMPESTLTKLCDFLKIPYSSSMFDFYRKKETMENASRIANWQNLAKPLMFANSGKYVDALSNDEIRSIERLCSAEMVAHSYMLTHPRQTYAADEKPKNNDLKSQADYVLSPEEKAIRKARQKIIDHINTLPIGL